MASPFRLQPLDETRRETGPLGLKGLPCVIGRSRDCDLRLNLDRISRQHLRLSKLDEDLGVEDLGSTNGTFVNNERIDDVTRLRVGDTLHIADYAFRLDLVSDPDRPAPPPRGGRPETLAGQTIAGFTEDPTGFPVQAPQFYELLNESLIEIRAWVGRLSDDPGEALLITARSQHPALRAGHQRLAQMARQLGEEARYHGLVRELATENADRIGLDQPTLILPLDAVEIEDAGVLLGELEALGQRYRRLNLACLVPAAELDGRTVEQLHSSLGRIGLPMVLLATGEAARGPGGYSTLAVDTEQAPRALGELV